MTPPTSHNLLLRSLPKEQMYRVMSVAELVHLGVREPIIEPNETISFVDFPESGVISIVSPMGDDKLVEIANIGYEGFVGSQVLLGVDSSPEQAFCQVPADAWRISTADFRQLVDESPHLSYICHRYVATLLHQIACNGSCNWIHSIEKRCARWLLLAHDRVEGDQFALTQETLAMMLGVTRDGVNLAAGNLAKANLINYVGGKVTILDRFGLEKAACECYSTMRAYFEKTLGSHPLTPPDDNAHQS
jgi:CRP-like cAMP-binding protein